ncbi:hypothetical protein XH83_05620 [Bradyrhizobium sp. CCBAU 53351]|uniref:PIN domain-containing protein n=1 Tax=Bradyrhizobium sp. CCBAU 53351 TaxID=1325114 RepID=UPI00188736CB|nr:PIN domain-containing protein [Bradyrhizobium sp. CCBAU 53351]QOZ74960.1 hypothetical protein XH83_05620 [Bradyrhizobium sp. CCBAU 53351]
MTDSGEAQLDTDIIFIDTETFVREKFDWNSVAFSRLKELVKAGHLRVLTTSITKKEVARKQQEALDNAAKSVKKHEVILGQLGGSVATEAINSPSAAAALEALFEKFLEDVKAREIPLQADLEKLFDDYFAQTPPFSGGKKSEFPDAVVLISLRKWRADRHQKIYVISGDPDMKAACGEGSDLLHVERLADVISMATVTKQVHDDLLKFLAESEHLALSLSDELMGSKVKITKLYWMDDIDDASGIVRDVTDFSIIHLNVISKEQNAFECEIEVEICLNIEFTVEVSRRSGFEDYDPSYTLYETEPVILYLYPVVVVRFDTAKPNDTEIESVYVSSDIEVEAGDVDVIKNAHRHRY